MAAHPSRRAPARIAYLRLNEGIPRPLHPLFSNRDAVAEGHTLAEDVVKLAFGSLDHNPKVPGSSPGPATDNKTAKAVFLFKSLALHTP